jgi:predicted cobalt transporter CbtA
MHQSIFWWFHQCHSIGVSLIVFYEQLYQKLLQSQGLLIITPILTKIYQQSINTGQIPEDWKNANIP